MVAVLSCTVTTVRPTNDTRPLLTRDGSYTVRNDALDVFYHSVHGAIQDTEGSDCTGEGVYTFKIEGNTLTMTRVSDPCADRGGPDGVMKMERG